MDQQLKDGHAAHISLPQNAGSRHVVGCAQANIPPNATPEHDQHLDADGDEYARCSCNAGSSSSARGNPNTQPHGLGRSSPSEPSTTDDEDEDDDDGRQDDRQLPMRSDPNHSDEKQMNDNKDLDVERSQEKVQDPAAGFYPWNASNVDEDCQQDWPPTPGSSMEVHARCSPSRLSNDSDGLSDRELAETSDAAPIGQLVSHASGGTCPEETLAEVDTSAVTL